MKIKTLIFLNILMILILNINYAKAQQVFECRVESVHDGDTFNCDSGIKIRVWGIDAPEIGPPRTQEPQPGSVEARDYLEEKILDETLICEKKSKSYNRIVAKCSLNNQDIAIFMLKNHLAKEKRHYSKGYYSFVNSSQ